MTILILVFLILFFKYFFIDIYELIRFTYNIKPVIKTFGQGLRQHTEYDKKWFTIFKSKDLPPPFHILILLYGTIYSTLDPLSKTEYKIFTYTNDEINSSSFRILCIFLKMSKYLVKTIIKNKYISNK